MSTEYKPSDRISVIKGVGPQKEKAFNENGIFTLEDLTYLFHTTFLF